MVIPKRSFFRVFSTMTETLCPPQACRGMTRLEKEKFKVVAELPVLEVDAIDIGLITRRVRLEPFLIGHKLRPLKNTMDSETDGKKYLVFHPDKINTEESREKIKKMLEIELGKEKVDTINWKIIAKQLTFENWDTKSLFKAILPKELDYSSYTQTGHIVHCNFADDLLPYRFVIAEILLNKINNCKTVVQKKTIITNVYRNLELELLAGEENYVTELKEEGLRYQLDFSKVYWNSRLSNEHARIIQKFDGNSLVYDACCGIGPFVLPAYVKKKPKRIIGNDLNPESVKWLKTNIKLNKIKCEAIKVYNMDAKDFIQNVMADDVAKQVENVEDDENVDVHVVMNLPGYATNFLPAFRGVLTKKINSEKVIKKRLKWNIYCYLFAKSHVDVEHSWYCEEAKRMCDEMLNWRESFVKSCHNVRTVSSRKEMFCVHIELPVEFLLAEPEKIGSEEPECKKIKA